MVYHLFVDHIVVNVNERRHTCTVESISGVSR